ncbi:degenerate transposase (orf2) [Streptococcus pneumoniae]|nr:degenerate transposase (orf2) [Streptococcus pneumoniae]
MTEFSLVLLLKAIKLARSTYYYHLKQLDKTDKDQGLKLKFNPFLSNTREIMVIVGFI